jgi:hypothetical protein
VCACVRTGLSIDCTITSQNNSAANTCPTLFVAIWTLPKKQFWIIIGDHTKAVGRVVYLLDNLPTGAEAGPR